MRLLAITVALLLTGCAGGPLGAFGMNEAQIRELTKVKDANVLCVEADVMLGAHKGSLVVASVDRGMAAQIIVDARGKCTVNLTVVK